MVWRQALGCIRDLGRSWGDPGTFCDTPMTGQMTWEAARAQARNRSWTGAESHCFPCHPAGHERIAEDSQGRSKTLQRLRIQLLPPTHKNTVGRPGAAQGRPGAPSCQKLFFAGCQDFFLVWGDEIRESALNFQGVIQK